MSSSRRNRRQQSQHRTGVALGIAGVLIAALLVYQVFVRSDNTAARSIATPAAGSVSVDGSSSNSTTTTAPLEPSLPNGSFDELSLRDPFEPPIHNGSGSGTTVTTTTTTTGSGTISTTPTSSPQQNPAPTTDVALLDVYLNTSGVQTARITVGSVEYTAVAGQTFAGNYVLVSFASDKCVNLSYADSPFSLCQGEQVTK
jgi:hypothetical protein